jgi:threonine/homoserine/homoserine lactone efflux protein
MEVHAGLGIAVVALGMALTPGPNMIYLVSRSIVQGRRAGLVSLLGVGAGYLVYLVAATAGIAAVFATVPMLYLAIRICGAAYLLWLAWKAVKPGGPAVFEPVDLPPDGTGKLFAMGFLTCLLNPKVVVTYVSLLPQFVDPARGHVGEQSLALGLVQITVGLGSHALIAMSAGSIAGFLTRRPIWLRVQRYLTGTVLASLAAKIVWERSSGSTG